MVEATTEGSAGGGVGSDDDLLNLSNIQLAKNPVFHARTKHVEVHYQLVREH